MKKIILLSGLLGFPVLGTASGFYVGGGAGFGIFDSDYNKIPGTSKESSDGTTLYSAFLAKSS